MRAECFSSFCLASLHKDGAEIRRKKVYKSEMQMRKDYSRDELGFPVELRDWKKQRWGCWSLGIASLFSLGNFFWTQDWMPVREEERERGSPFRELSLFRSLLDICRYCTAERAPRHSVECVESYFTNRYANIVSVWRPTRRRRTSVGKIYITRAVSSLPPQQHFNFSLLAISPTLSFSFSFPFSLGFFSSRARAAR